MSVIPQERQVSAAGLLSWFEEVGEAFREIPPELVFNFDESFVNLRGHTYAYVFDEGRAITFEENKLPSHITFMPVINAAGRILKEILLISTVRSFPLPSTLKSTYLYKQTSNGWITNEIFLDFVVTAVIPFVNECRELAGLPPDKKAVLVSDGHGSRFQPEVLQALIDNHIDLVVLPPHTSHVMQPLDVCFFSQCKRKHKEFVKEHIKPGSSNEQKRAAIVTALDDAIASTAMTHTLRKGFAMTGLCPFDKTKVVTEEYVLTGKFPKHHTGFVADIPVKERTRNTVHVAGVITSAENVRRIFMLKERSQPILPLRNPFANASNEIEPDWDYVNPPPMEL